MTDSILKIIAPWISLEKDNKKADEEKLTEILNILKPEEISSWCDDLWNTLYLSEKNAPMDMYFSFIELPTSFFFRKSLTKEYESFNQKFRNLRRFLLTHFFANHNNLNFVQLYPELRETNPTLYAQRLEELRALVTEFQDGYNKFVAKGKEKYVGIFTVITSLLLLGVIAIGWYWKNK